MLKLVEPELEPLHVRALKNEHRRKLEKELEQLEEDLKHLEEENEGIEDPYSEEGRNKRREIRRADRRLGLRALAIERLDALGRGYKGLALQAVEAARDGDADYVRLCLDAKVDPDTHDQFGATPIIAAASSNRLATVKLLLERGADPRCQDLNGATCAHYCVHLSHFHVMHAILATPENWDCFTIKDARGMSAVDYARKPDKKQCMQLIKHSLGGNFPVVWQVFKGWTWDLVGIGRQKRKGGCCSCK